MPPADDRDGDADQRDDRAGICRRKRFIGSGPDNDIGSGPDNERR
jgi:hypothetical protein